MNPVVGYIIEILYFQALRSTVSLIVKWIDGIGYMDKYTYLEVIPVLCLNFVLALERIVLCKVYEVDDLLDFQSFKQLLALGILPTGIVLMQNEWHQLWGGIF
jgi:hypothetical protein